MIVENARQELGAVERVIRAEVRHLGQREEQTVHAVEDVGLLGGCESRESEVVGESASADALKVAGVRRCYRLMEVPP